MLPIMSWDQLATAVLARRKELGLTQIGAAKAGDLSPDIIRNIENRRRTPKQVNPRTAAKIERALEWEPGSVVATVAGGKPTPIKHSALRSPRTNRSRIATIRLQTPARIVRRLSRLSWTAEIGSLWPGRFWPCAQPCLNTSVPSARTLEKR